MLEVLSLSLRSRERLSSFNKNNRDNRAVEIKLNTSFRGAYFFFFWNKRIKLLNQISSWSWNLQAFFYICPYDSKSCLLNNCSLRSRLKKGRGRKSQKGKRTLFPTPPPFFSSSQSPNPFDACYAGVNNWGLEQREQGGQCKGGRQQRGNPGSTAFFCYIRENIGSSIGIVNTSLVRVFRRRRPDPKYTYTLCSMFLQIVLLSRLSIAAGGVLLWVSSVCWDTQ